MRKPKVEDQELLASLMSVIRTKGYDGASLNELANSSGLKKASLYHRFPGGKEEISAKVLATVNEYVQQNIQQVLADGSKVPTERLKLAIQNIRSVYADGETSCIFRALSMDNGLNLFAEQIQQGMEIWLAGFTQLGIDLGWAAPLARQSALKTLSAIQGSLVVSKGLGNTEAFGLVLKEIENQYKAS